ncbi:hypothetical protein [Winogradskyella pulchriflava]|uniref:Right handed beta helix domain-containing protein n=1 Tax=Winogradskyella pulchriflava TaxID=1110688 RepID=A0ABV6Q7D1_9FLAO
MKTKLLLTTIALILFQFAVAQTVYTVDNRPESGAQYTTVQAAIDAASAGDVIYIHPSPTSYGSVNVTKTLKLVGPGHNPENSDGLTADLSTIALHADSANSIITGLVLSNITAYSLGTNTHGIHIINNRITNYIDGYAFDGQSNNWIVEGNYFDAGSYLTDCIRANNLNNLQVRNNIIKGQISSSNHTNVFTNNLFIQEDPSGDAQVFVGSNGITSPIVANNMFVFTDADITGLSSTGTAITYTNCLTWKVAGGTPLPALSGSGNLDNTDPQFANIPTSLTDYYNNDYSLNAGSPAIGSATDSGDLGIFGRNFPYDINGRAHSMPYPEAMTILNTVVQPGQDLNVEFQATQKN